MKEKIIIFCDGASKGNPGPGGWGAIVAAGNSIYELGGFEKHTTNNRMELMAAVEALQKARELSNGEVTVYTDSSYVINGITKWVKGWQRNGWLTQEKKPVLNQDLWEPLVKAAENFDATIVWQYVGGHVGIEGNERVDSIASDFALGEKVELYNGPLNGYLVNVKNITFDKTLVKQKSASKERSKLKAYSYVSVVGGVIEKHKTWAECEARVKSKAARFKKALSEEDEAAIVKEFSVKK
ncbi:MAG TPA: ribonuclease HI [Candidatus Paceibacterota bacterium]|nr:ribonuclease HI [Candidatus Paceibacterota bacterium]